MAQPSQVYEHAASVLRKVLNKEASLKSLCYSSECRNKQQLYALAMESLKHRELISKVLNHSVCSLLEWNGLTSELKIILVYESLFGKGIKSDSRYFKQFNSAKDVLGQALAEVTATNPETVVNMAASPVPIPRYVRVNTLKISAQYAMNAFIDHGFKIVDEKNYANLKERQFCKDADIPNLLVFPAGSDFHAYPLYKDGSIVLQDKASCLPAYILNPPEGATVIDACAAPGNKSSHLAAILKNRGTIYAFDLDKKRLEVMRAMISTAGCSCVRACHKDFLKVRHDHPVYSRVEYILLDPSCSGSGIVSRRDDLVDDKADLEVRNRRLDGLSRFQTAALSHALSFPNVKRVVYSTCSVHKQENEDVVLKAAKRFSDRFRLVTVLPQWRNRGLEGAEECIRAVPGTDLTNGFFVAMFERIGHKDVHAHSSNHLEVSGKTSSGANSERLSSLSESNLPDVTVTLGMRGKRRTDRSLDSGAGSAVSFSDTVPRKRRKRNRVKKPVAL